MTIVKKYFTTGTESEVEGLTLMVAKFNSDTGEMVSGFGAGPDSWYKAKEVTKKKYDEIKAKFQNSDTPRGHFGIVNQTGLGKFKAAEQAGRERIDAVNEQHFSGPVAEVESLFLAGTITEDQMDSSLASRGVPKNMVGKIKENAKVKKAKG